MNKYSNNPFKKAFSKFKKRRYSRKLPLFKNPRYQEVSVKCEYMDAIWVPSVGSTFLHHYNGYPYFNFASLMSVSNSWTSIFQNFEMYKITGVSSTIMPTNTTQFTTFSFGAPSISIGISFVETNTTMGPTAFSNDTQNVCHFLQTTPARKYFSIPKDYLQGNIAGLGTWNRCDYYTNQIGQFCTVMADLNTNTGALVYMYNVTYCIYVSLKQRSQ